MENKEVSEMDTLYQGVLDGCLSTVDELAEERRLLQVRIIEVNKRIQENLLLNKEIMETLGFLLISEDDIKYVYSRGKYRLVTDIFSLNKVLVYDGLNTNPFEFVVESIDELKILMKLLCI